MKTPELTGVALDWAVAKCVGWKRELCYLNTEYPNYSENWALGGPIIERIGGFQLKIWLESRSSSKCEAHIHNHEGDWVAFGPTPLIAAMRCYVASKLGDEVEVPEELK